MALGRAKNRRRADARERAEEVRGAVRQHGGTAFRLVVSILVTASVVYGGYRSWGWALTSPTFALSTISFTGLHRAKEAELLKLGSLNAGQNLFQLDTAATAKAMAAHPWVKKVDVTRHFPSALSVEVEERVPAGMVVLGDLYLVDADGEPFRRVQAGDSVDLPLLSGVDRDAYVAAPAETTRKMREAVEVADQYAKSDAGRGLRLSEVRIGDDVGGGLTLVVGKTGEEIRLGQGDVGQKLARLAEVRAALASRQLSAEVIHLDNRQRPGWVAVRLVQGDGADGTSSAGAKASASKGAAVPAKAPAMAPVKAPQAPAKAAASAPAAKVRTISGSGSERTGALGQ